jgi:hypothetical protein
MVYFYVELYIDMAVFVALRTSTNSANWNSSHWGACCDIRVGSISVKPICSLAVSCGKKCDGFSFISFTQWL